jgi:hypothetical protein
MKSDSFIPIQAKKQKKLISSFPKYLHALEKPLIRQYGNEAASEVTTKAWQVYPGIVQTTPTFKTPMYDALMVEAGRLAALKKGMKMAGLSTEQFVRFNIEQSRSKAGRIPSWIKRVGGRMYLSGIMRRYLKKVARSISSHGWPTKVIDGSSRDGFAMSVETRDCQMVKFWESVGEGDIKPYCTFFDFTAAESLGMGLKQVSTIDSGVCKYCFYRNGSVEWPENIRKILD